jgi:threonine/homoserine efflux transporter RhtA
VWVGVGLSTIGLAMLFGIEAGSAEGDVLVLGGAVAYPHGWTGALLVTGIFASALAFLVQTWAQRDLSATRTALVFAAEPVFAGLFGYLLAGDRLGAMGWAGCALILTGIVVSEPGAATTLRRLALSGEAREET